MKKRKIHKVQSFFAIFDPAAEGGYNVSFPDFPGCLTFGRTFEEAKEKAREVLELWIEELRSAKREIPHYVRRPIIDEIEIVRT